jgi:hypothetical protein
MPRRAARRRARGDQRAPDRPHARRGDDDPGAVVVTAEKLGRGIAGTVGGRAGAVGSPRCIAGRAQIPTPLAATVAALAAGSRAPRAAPAELPRSGG